MAAASPTFRGTLLLSEQIGDTDEIEDVVVVDEGRVMLASAKARMVRQELLKGALSAAEVLAWFESFLFGKPSGDQRGGALRLLDQNVARVRAGAHVERGLTADCRILPILVTFDNLGADNLPLHIWLTERCRAEGLLQQPGVAPVLILHVEKFELLMAFAAAGRDMFEIFLDRDPAQRADIALFDASEGLESTRLPGLEQRYQAVVERLQDRLATALKANADAAASVAGR